jgi:hypothetical protein
VLRPDGLLLFRDYGLYDHAMLRFSAGHKLSDNFYVRQDGTRAYYFSLGLFITSLTKMNNSNKNRIKKMFNQTLNQNNLYRVYGLFGYFVWI